MSAQLKIFCKNINRYIPFSGGETLADILDRISGEIPFTPICARVNNKTEDLRMNQNFFLAGVSNVTDLLDAQTLDRQSLDRFTEAYGEYCVARATYLDATGQDFCPKRV